MKLARGKRLWMGLGLATVVAGVAVFMACASTSTGNASASKVSRREQLIGGQRALADVGDYKISNGIIQAIVQEVGRSRGPGAFGGFLIDVDLVRGGRGESSRVPLGNDMFTEMFPAFFLQAVEPSKVEVTADGSDGGPAVIRVSGKAGDFLSLVKNINGLVLPAAALDYQVEYILEPGKQYLKVATTITNASPIDASFTISAPFGFVTLLGEGQELFVPGKGGFDMRFRLDEVYALPSDIEALPGEVSSMLVTEGAGVSYGLAVDEKGANYLRTKPGFYATAKKDSLLIPVASGAFMGAFWGQPPSTMKPKESYTYTGYLAVGNGDVASVQQVLYDLKGKKYRQLAGYVREKGSLSPVKDVSIVVQDDAGNYVTATRTLANGLFSVPVEPGKYRIIAHDSVRSAVYSATETKDYYEVTETHSPRVDLEVERPAFLSVSVRDTSGQMIPAKITVEGTYEFVSTDPARSFLYNLRVGERQRPIDLVTDHPDDPKTRRYLEAIFFAPNGRGGTEIRVNNPGTKYRVYASRGIEYDVAYADVDLRPGEEKQVTLTLNHVMPTPGYISGDFHVHSINSVDSFISLPSRVATFVAEGVDLMAATDHNYVTDLKPTVQGMRLDEWIKPMVGIELTTIEMGHFNAYPVKYLPGPVNHGSFNWFYRPPGELFAGLRAMGAFGPQKTIVQVNHPRDGIMGYFEAFNIGAYTGTPLPFDGAVHIDASEGSPYAPSQFSFDFDALELFNGKHQEQLHHYRVPADPGPGGDPSEPIPAVGEVLETLIDVPDANAPGGVRQQAQPAFPGTLDDYYLLLSQGREFSAMGNSDTHSARAEAGLPRTFVYVGASAEKSLAQLSDETVVDGILARRTVVTNGPFIEMSVNDQPLGSHVVSPDGSIRVKIRVEAAPWVDVRSIVLKLGYPGMGKLASVLATLPVEPSEGRVRYEGEHSFADVPDRAFIVAEVTGENSMWPVYTPIEIPSVQINEAVSSLAGSFGFTDKWGRYRPQRIQQVKPFAFTSPIWIDRQLRQQLKASRKAMPLEAPTGPHQPVRIPNLTKLFGQYHGH